MSYNCDQDSILSELEDNIDECVCVTTCGGTFRGLLTGVSDDACKIVCRGCVTVCRLRDIEAVTFIVNNCCC